MWPRSRPLGSIAAPGSSAIRFVRWDPPCQRIGKRHFFFRLRQGDGDFFLYQLTRSLCTTWFGKSVPDTH